MTAAPTQETIYTTGTERGAVESTITTNVKKGDEWMENGKRHRVQNVKDNLALIALHTKPGRIVRRIENVSSVALRMAAAEDFAK